MNFTHLCSLALLALVGCSSTDSGGDDPSGTGGTGGAAGTSGGSAGTDTAGGSAGSDDTKPTYHDLTVRWSVEEADGKPAACSTNYDKIGVVVLSVNGGTGYTSSPNGDQLFGVFDCAQKQGTVHLLASGDEPFVYGESGTRMTTQLDGKTTTLNRSPITNATGRWRVTLYVTEASGETRQSPTLTQDVDVSKQDASLDFVIYPTANRLLETWGLNAKSNANVLSCAAAGVDSVRLTRTRTRLPDYSPDPSPKSTVMTYPCGATVDDSPNCSGCVGAGQSSALEYGWYTVKAEALMGDKVVGTNSEADMAAELPVDATNMYITPSGVNTFTYEKASHFLTITTR